MLLFPNSDCSQPFNMRTGYFLDHQYLTLLKQTNTSFLKNEFRLPSFTVSVTSFGCLAGTASVYLWWTCRHIFLPLLYADGLPFLLCSWYFTGKYEIFFLSRSLKLLLLKGVLTKVIKIDFLTALAISLVALFFCWKSFGSCLYFTLPLGVCSHFTETKDEKGLLLPKMYSVDCSTIYSVLFEVFANTQEPHRVIKGATLMLFLINHSVNWTSKY